MMNIEGKKMLFIGVGFYDYEDAIKKELEKRGAIVIHFSLVYFSIWKWVLTRLRLSKIVKWNQMNYILKKIAQLPNSVDCLFIIKGDGLVEKHLELINEKYGDIPKVLYLWDSIVRHKNKELLLNRFDNILTFDRVDAAKYNLKFRPLFYRVELEPKNEFKYDISFIGELHSDRYKILTQIKDQLKSYGYTYRFQLYIGRTTYFFKRYIAHEIRKGDEEFFMFKKMEYNDYIKLSSDSHVILDIAHPLQSGLTIRAIEAIAFNRNILTTNPDIENYDNIDRRMYSIIDRQNPIIDFSIFQKREINNNKAPYSLESFIDTILASLV